VFNLTADSYWWLDLEIAIGKTKLQLIRGDITEQDTDAIVNAANSSLMGGGGVDGAIHRKGGSQIKEECKKIRAAEWPKGLPTGKAVITSGGNLRARKVIHTVGPVWRGGGDREEGLLVNAYSNSLALAVSNRLKTISFPSISTGAYGYPIREASRIALRTVKEFLEREDKLERVVFVLFDQRGLKIYEEVAKELFHFGMGDR
jgi:O-acetyl-ADP-ribose deacetylase (regulator of RNase III)